jgi:two-component system phosphate regulon sensor histidine kinase PhoR
MGGKEHNKKQTEVEQSSESATELALRQAHEDFISTISHEFRTPLTSIKGFADTLLHYSAQLPEEEKRRFITIIKDQADRLIRLVENLLSVSTLGEKASLMADEARPVLLKPLLGRVIQSVQAKAYSKTQLSRKFELTCKPSDLAVWANADQLEQVLLNLIDNASKYSPPDTMVRVWASFKPCETPSSDPSSVLIEVQDFGRGIPADQLPRIFTKFYRVEAPLSQEVEGTGLGLYIAQSLTQAMGGTLAVQSESGKGSLFTLIVPAATIEHQALFQKRRAASTHEAESSQSPSENGLVDE